MSTPVTSKCINFTGNFETGPITVTINPSDYPTLLTPSILPVTITLPNLNPPYDVDVKIGTTVSYTLSISSDNVGTTTKVSPGVSVTFPKGQTDTNSQGIPNATINSVVLSTKNINNPPYANGDEYLITMIAEISPSPCSQIVFTRVKNITIDTAICGNIKDLCTTSCKTVRIPAICIAGQTLLDGSDVSDMTFTIFDKCQYYEEKCIVDNSQNKCQLLRIKCSDLKETKFIKCCPWMVSVTRGKGETLREKLEYLISKNLQPEGMGIEEFLYNIVFYGMTRYILSRILYGKFDINYLLEKYYKRFIKDLGRSRFCIFVEFFEDCRNPEYNFVGYEKYFLCDLK